MAILAIDTATEVSSVALWENGLVDELVDDSGTLASRVILSQVDSLLRNTACPWDNIDYIAFGHGPGAFTGLRIATGIVQGLSLGYSKPVIGVSTLAAVALQAIRGKPEQPVLAVQDARLNELYAGCYQLDSQNRLISQQQDQLCTVDGLSLPGAGDWLIAGNAYYEYADKISQALGTTSPESTLTWVQGITSTASAIAELSQQTLNDNISPVSAESVKPVYLRNKVTH